MTLINRLFVLDVRHQSRLNRLFTENPFSRGAFNRGRLALWQSLPGTKRQPKGGLSLDDTRRTPSGQHVATIGYPDDSARQGGVWAHHLVTLHDRDDQTDAPIDCRLWEPADLATLATGLSSTLALLSAEAGMKRLAYLMAVSASEAAGARADSLVSCQEGERVEHSWEAACV